MSTTNTNVEMTSTNTKRPSQLPHNHHHAPMLHGTAHHRENENSTNNNNRVRERRSSRHQSIDESIKEQTKDVCCCGCVVDKREVIFIQTISLFVIIIVLGGAIFSGAERSAEIMRNNKNNESYTSMRARVLTLLNHNETLFNLLTEEGLLLPPEPENNWNFNSACVFAFTVVTTIGCKCVDYICDIFLLHFSVYNI